MVRDEPFLYCTTEFDQRAFDLFVPPRHPLVLALHGIDWEKFRPKLAEFYSPSLGPPAIDPVRMLKLEFLKYWFGLSDSQVFARLQTDLAFRYFVQVGFQFRLPDPSLLCYFRARLGPKGYQAVFNELVAQARQLGLVKDRLRLKDASHVVANIAVPTTLALVAKIRDRLLDSLEPFDPDWVSGQRIELNLLRGRTKDQAAETRLMARVVHLQELVAWAETLPPPVAEELNAATETAWQQVQNTLALAKKILQDRQPNAEHKTLSLTDLEARRGKHGGYYDGYLIDILMDADSGLITQINVLSAGGDEPGDAVEMVRAEQNVHGNQIENLSIDGIGFHGPMLRELEGPTVTNDATNNITNDATNENPNAAATQVEQEITHKPVLNIIDPALPYITNETEVNPVSHPEVTTGLGVKVFVPPKPIPEEHAGRFTNADFQLHADGESVTCPAGQTSTAQHYDAAHHTTSYRFSRATCEACPLKARCLSPSAKRTAGRTVTKNDYNAEYQRVRQRAKTAEYAAVRREHPAVERKLNELMNHHDGRHAKFCGQAKVLAQELMTGFVVNAKHLCKFLLAPLRAEPCKTGGISN